MAYLIAREYYNVPVFSKLIHDIECVPVNRSGVDTASVKAALRHLEQGKMLGIFPQGGIRPPDDQSPPREGVGLLALRSGATVVPAYITGIEYTKSVARPFLKRQRAEVRYGKPVDLSRWKGREKNREAFREASEAIMAAIRALAPHDPSRPPSAGEAKPGEHSSQGVMHARADDGLAAGKV
jgi:1-acyl-sn-glycerol-3-phosphate acyltransferase